MSRLSRRAVIALPAVLAACTGKPSFRDPVLSTRQLRMEEFFDGRLRAQGQFQDILGTVRRRFDVDIRGDWDGERLRLVEDFVYEDGSTEQRIWTLVKTGNRAWQGTAPGVIGVATGLDVADVGRPAAEHRLHEAVRGGYRAGRHQLREAVRW